MLKVEMDGTVYMCQCGQRTNLNAFDVNPLEIWNSDRFKELRYQLDTEQYDSTCLDCHILRNKRTLDAETEKMRVAILDYRIINNVVVNTKRQLVPTNALVAGFVDAVEQTQKSLTIAGWAADMNANRPCKFVVVFIDGFGRAASCVDLQRNDVAAHFNQPQLAKSGYNVVVSHADELASGVRVRIFALDEVGNAGELAYPKHHSDELH